MPIRTRRKRYFGLNARTVDLGLRFLAPRHFQGLKYLLSVRKDLGTITGKTWFEQDRILTKHDIRTVDQGWVCNVVTTARIWRSRPTWRH